MLCAAVDCLLRVLYKSLGRGTDNHSKTHNPCTILCAPVACLLRVRTVQEFGG